MRKFSSPAGFCRAVSRRRRETACRTGFFSKQKYPPLVASAPAAGNKCGAVEKLSKKFLFLPRTSLQQPVNSIPTFKIEGIEGQEIDLAAFRGKKIMVVNVASECGYTPQYRQLQELYEAFTDKLVIIGFPCNDFGGQEPGANEAISAFCSRRYGVSFPLAAKISIKGPSPHPVYRWLTQKALNGVADSEVRWNFHKYLLDEEGRLVAGYPSSVSPIDERILDWLSS